jgi:hypothetical protein
MPRNISTAAGMWLGPFAEKAEPNCMTSRQKAIGAQGGNWPNLVVFV